MIHGKRKATTKHFRLFGTLLMMSLAAQVYANSTSQVNVSSKQAGISADYNRDGIIKVGEGSKPFLLWVNNDNDDVNSETSGIDIAVESDTSSDDNDIEGPDGDNNYIDGTRDLIDFFPIAIDLNNYLNTTDYVGKYTFWLQHDDEAVNVVYTIMGRGTLNNTDLSSNYLKTIKVSDVKPIFGDWQTNGPLKKVSVHPVFDNGTEIPEKFIELIKNDSDKGVILVEATRVTNKPLNLLIKDKNGNTLFDASLPLRVHEVTDLYRQVSFRGKQDNIARDELSETWGESPKDVVVQPLLNSLTEQSTSIQARSPDVQLNKHVIFVHGFKVDINAAISFQSETFKRLYHSGSNALFTGVHWKGDEGIPAGVNYWDNVENAFYVADDLAATVNGMNGSKAIIAHSLGNIVVGSAIQDFTMGFNQYFMLNPAVALEAYDNEEESPANMRNIDWDEYYFGSDYSETNNNETYTDQAGRRLWSVEWHTLFLGTTDERKNLTWRNRFSKVGDSSNVVQYYSSGEDVLQPAQPGDPNDLGPVFNNGRNAWNIQEKAKGTAELAAILGGGSSAGWGFNGCTYDVDGTETFNPCYELSHLQAEQFFDKPDSELIQKPFFDPFENEKLNELNTTKPAILVSFPHDLGYEIPALSFAAGGAFSAQFVEEENAVDMNAIMQDGWPAARLQTSSGNQWHHSDFKNIAYRYTYPLFNDLVERGALK